MEFDPHWIYNNEEKNRCYASFNVFFVGDAEEMARWNTRAAPESASGSDVNSNTF